MTTLLAVLHFVNVFVAAILAGGQLCVLLVIVPTKRRFPTVLSVQVHNAMLGHQIDGYMKPAGIVAGVCALVILALEYNRLSTPSLVFLGVELMGVVGVIITSRFFNVRTNATMAKWSLDAIPENYPEIRQGWDRVHTVRTFCGILALVGSILGILAQTEASPGRPGPSIGTEEVRRLELMPFENRDFRAKPFEASEIAVI